MEPEYVAQGIMDVVKEDVARQVAREVARAIEPPATVALPVPQPAVLDSLDAYATSFRAATERANRLDAMYRGIHDSLMQAWTTSNSSNTSRWLYGAETEYRIERNGTYLTNATDVVIQAPTVTAGSIGMSFTIPFTNPYYVTDGTPDTFRLDNGWLDSVGWQVSPPPPPETAEQRIAREERERQAMIAAQARAAKKKAIEEKAEKLLLRFLDERQRVELLKNEYFEFTVPSGRRYRIHRGRAMNILLIGGDGKPEKRLCAHPTLMVPDGDTMLAQKLALENDEDSFLKIANVVPMRGPNVNANDLLNGTITFANDERVMFGHAQVAA